MTDEHNRRAVDSELNASFGMCPHFHAHTNAADHAVKKVFAILGVDIDKPESVEEFRNDLRFGKRIRKASEHGQLLGISVFVSGIAYAIWIGIKSAIMGVR